MEPLETKLNLETARVAWSELARHFASGKVIRVAAELDLIHVATAVAQDEAVRVGRWMSADRVAPVSDAEARAWQEADAVLWAVVVKPFVLVQVAVDDR